MTKEDLHSLLLCPTTGNTCTHKMPVTARPVTLRRWTGGNVKATVCSIECAEKWADDKGYMVIGESTVYTPRSRTTVLIVQHPDQVPPSVRRKK